MELTMKDKFARIQLSKLPDDVKSEAEMIRDITENFSDPDLCEAAQDNFNELYGIIEKKHPDALKVGKAAKVPKGTKKKAAAKPAAPKQVDPYGFQVGQTVYIIQKEHNDFDPSYPAWRIVDLNEGGQGIKIKNLDTDEPLFISSKALSVNLPAGSKRASMKDVKLDECKKILREADYDISKKLVKGKRIHKRKKRSDKAIINDHAEEAMGTTRADIPTDKPQSDEVKKLVDKFTGQLQKLIQKVDKIATQDLDVAKLKKIVELLGELVD